MLERAQVSFEVWSKGNVNRIDKFWKNDFYVSTLFKFVRGLHVKE